MIFRVRWERKALGELANVWTNADSMMRQVITKASRSIDKRLRHNPRNEGESRAKGRRIMFVPPFSVTFRVEADDQTVSVLEIWMVRQRGK
jgi:hypothetical protein